MYTVYFQEYLEHKYGRITGITLIWLLISIATLTGWLVGGRVSALALGSIIGLCAWGWLETVPSKAPPGPVKVGPDSTYATSTACRGCHPKEWDSWSGTFHRTMTQLPTADAILADFDVSLSGPTGSWRLYRDQTQYKAEHTMPSGEKKTALVSLLTGSHHMQNYWLSVGDGWLIQLPWVWWIHKKRWIPVEASFLRPAPQRPEAPAVWNDECVYCHTTHGMRGAARDAERTQSTARELGVGCEACHGPGQRHIEYYQKPWNRYLGWFSRPNTDIVSGVPSKGNTTAICAQCHGLFAHLKGTERDRLGDPHRPGDDLNLTRRFLRLKPAVLTGKQAMLPASEPSETTLLMDGREFSVNMEGLAPDGLHVGGGPRTPGRAFMAVGRNRINGQWIPTRVGGFFAVDDWPHSTWRSALDAMGYEGVDFRPYDWQAFWDDGTMRTAGRAFNGMADSACAIEGELNCGSCHTMHGDEPNDQLKSGHRSNEACAQCHQAYVDSPAAHTHHKIGSSGSECQNCHMPHTTYGLLGASRAHRIDVPRPAEMQRRKRPNACNLCHLDKPVQWAQLKVETWYEQAADLEPIPPQLKDVAAAFVWLLTGDAAVRAIATWHLGWQPAREVSQVEAWIGPILPILAVDEYAAVRAIFEHVLPGLEPDLVYDFMRPSAPLVPPGNDKSSSPRASPNKKPTNGPRLDASRIAELLRLRSKRPVTISE